MALKLNVEKARAAGFTDQQIQEYMAQKGVGASSAPQPQSGNFVSGVGSFINSLAKPFYQMPAAAAYEAALLARSKSDPNIYNTSAGDNPFLDENKMRTQDLALQQAKNSLNVLSWGVPLGKGTSIAGKAIPGLRPVAGGATVGLMQGLSADNVTPEGVIGSTVLGGGTAGVLNKLLGTATKPTTTTISPTLKRSMSDRLKSAAVSPRPITKGSPKGALEMDEVLDIGLDIPGKTARAKYSNMALMAQDAESKLNNVLNSSKKLYSVDDVAKSILDETAANAKHGFRWGRQDSMEAWQEVVEQLRSKAKNGKVTLADIQEVKKTISNEAQNAFNQLEGGRTVSLSGGRAKDLRKGIDVFMKSEAPKGYAEANKVIEKLNKAQNSIEKRALTNNQIRMLGVNMGPNLTPLADASSTTAGNVLGKTGGRVAGLRMGANKVGATPDNLTKILMASANASGPGAQPQALPEDQLANTQGETDPLGLGFTLTPLDVITAKLTLDEEAAALVEEIYKMQEEATGKSTNLSATTENRVQLARSGLRALNELENIYAKDPTRVLKAAIPGNLGARDFESASIRAVEGLLRARSGAAVPPEEVRRYRRANLPSVGDSLATAQMKLDAFRADLMEVANSGSTMPSYVDILTSGVR